MAHVDFRTAIDKTVTIMHKTYSVSDTELYVPMVFDGCQYLRVDRRRDLDEDGIERKEYDRKVILSEGASQVIKDLDLDGDYCVIGRVTAGNYSFKDITKLKDDLFKIQRVYDRLDSGVQISHPVLDKYVSCIALEGDRI